MTPPTAPPSTPPYATAPGGSAMLPRPGIVTSAAVTMIVLGALIALLGLFFAFVGAFVGGAANEINSQTPAFPGMAGAVAGVLIVFAVILLAIGILNIVAGANVLGGRGWARITGIVVAVLVGLFALLGLFGGGDSRTGGSIVVSLIVVAANAFIIWALATTGSWFAARTR